jgi:hypothetical protein
MYKPPKKRFTKITFIIRRRVLTELQQFSADVTFVPESLKRALEGYVPGEPNESTILLTIDEQQYGARFDTVNHDAKGQPIYVLLKVTLAHVYGLCAEHEECYVILSKDFMTEEWSAQPYYLVSSKGTTLGLPAQRQAN